MWRDFFYFSRGERRAIVFLVTLGILLYVGIHVADSLHSHPEPAEPNQEMERFLTEVRIRESYEKSSHSHKRTPQEEKDKVVSLFPFNPNRADSSSLRALGLPVYVVRNILKYRRHGGTFRTTESFSKIYGLTPELFQRLQPYIRVKEEKATSSIQATAERDTAPIPPPVFARQEKYAEGTRVCLNTADSTSLKKIPGIGSGYAVRILAYRKRMGGFYDVAQLDEVKGLPDGLKQWFYIGTSPQRNIKINRWNVEQLRAHPYISFYQAKAIVEHRHKYGKIENVSQLEMYEEFSPHDLKRLEPYMNYD